MSQQQVSSDSPAPRAVKKLSGLFLLILIIVNTLIISVGLMHYRYLKTETRLDAENELQALATLKLNQLTAWREEKLKNTSLMAENPFVKTHIAKLMNAPGSPEALLLKDWLKTLLETYGYDQISILKNDGALVASIHPDKKDPFRIPEETIHFEHSQWIPRASREPVLSDIHIGTENVHPHMSVIISIFSTEDDSTPAGLIALNLNLEKFLYPLIESWPTPSKTAETLLVRKDGEDVLFLNNLRHQPGSAMTFRIPLSRTRLPASQAISGRTGPYEGLDYRGEKVFSVISPVPDSNWFMVTKIDKREALSGWLAVSKKIVVMICTLLLASTAVFYLIWARQTKNQYRELFLNSDAVRKMEARHRVELMSIGDAVITTNITGHIEFMNPVAEKLTGWTIKDALGKPLSEIFRIINETSRKPVEDPVALVLNKMGAVGMANHTILIDREGKERPIADSGSPVFDDEKNLIGVVLVFRDQTEEIRTQKTLSASRERFHKAIDLSPFPAMIHAEDGRILLINQEWQNLSGYTAEDLPGIEDWVEKAYGEKSAEVKAYIQELYAQTERIDEGEFTIQCRDGGSRIWSFASMPLGRDPEEQRLVLSMAVDITEKKQLENRLLQAEKLESVGKLAGGVAHDFNNLLMGIMNYVDLCLQEVNPGTSMHEWLNEINNIAERSAGITRQLLAFARKQNISPEVIHFDQAVPKMIKMLQRLMGEDIELSWQPALPLWPVLMDGSQFDQILANLALNARDAIAGVGKVMLSAENVTLDHIFCRQHLDAVPGEYVVFSVRDNGSGMDAEALKHAFEPFYTSKAVGKGTGLGLATVYGIVHQNKGFIHLQSELEKGTTFHIYLPRYAGNPENSTRIEEKIEQMSGGNETILLTEDEETIRNTLNQYLSKKGYRVLSAEHPEEGFRVARAFNGKIDLLVTDLIMPGMNGRDFADKLLKDFPQLKILFISGYTADVIAQRELLAGNVHFLPKPFTGNFLERKIREILDS